MIKQTNNHQFFAKLSLFAHRHQTTLLTCLIILLGGFLRFYNLNWDQGYSYHPDERNIAMAVNTISIPHQLNPHFFAYGGLLIYLIRLIAQALNFFTHSHDWTSSWSNIDLIGRYLSAIFATWAIYLVFIIVRRLINSSAALVASLLVVLTPGLIQYAHYGVTESMLVFFLLSIIYLTIKIIEEYKWRYIIFTAFIGGLAVGTKTSALIFLLIPLIGLIIQIAQTKKISTLFPWLIFPFLAGLTFFVVTPYSILDYQAFHDSMHYESGVALGTIAVPYTLQFHNTTPYLFNFINLHWQTGLFVPTIGFLGLAVLLVLCLKTMKNISALTLSLFTFIYFLYIGAWYTKFVRYMVPIIPLLIIGTVWLAYYLISQMRLKIIGQTLLALLIIGNLIWTTFYFSIYYHPQPWITASQWIYSNIPKGRTLVVEHWDDQLPTALNNYDLHDYNYLTIKNFDPDTLDKISQTADQLSAGDYLILATRRLSGSIPKDPQKYPFTSTYYKKLFSGQLGYSEVQQFSSYPSLLGLQINDDHSEETFQVYDHPVVKIFKKTTSLSSSQLYSILINAKTN